MKTLRKLLLNPWSALITLALIVAVRINDGAFVESIRLRYFDTLIAQAPASRTGTKETSSVRRQPARPTKPTMARTALARSARCRSSWALRSAM